MHTAHRCSTSQLESIATTLEPLFHRDFVTSLQKRYPSAPFRRLKDPVNDHKEVEGFALELANEIIESAMLTCISLEDAENVKNGYADVKALNIDFETDVLGNVQCMSAPTPFIVAPGEATIKEEEEESGIDSEFTEVRNQNKAESDRDLKVELPLDINEVDDEDEADVDAVNKFSFIKAMSQYDGPRKIHISRQLLTSFEYVSRPPLEARLGPMSFQDNLGLLLKRQHVSITNQQRMCQSYPHIVPSSSEGSCIHHHHGGVSTAKVDITDCFDKSRITKFGPIQAQLRTGSVRRPSHITDLGAPRQKMYKHGKFWRPNPTEGRTFIRTKDSAFKWHFREQLNCIWEWMTGWEEFEKLNLLVEVVKLCDGELLNYLTQCLIERLRERVDISWLSDSLLILIFSYLPQEDIDACSRVCRRWRYLSSCNELWMIKSQEFGSLVIYVEIARSARWHQRPSIPIEGKFTSLEHGSSFDCTEGLDQGIPNILELVHGAERCGQSVDWRLAYQELQSITEQAQHSLPLPGRLAFQGITPVGMKRVGGKFMRASEPASIIRGGSGASQISGSTVLNTVCESNMVTTIWRPLLLREPESSLQSPILDPEDGEIRNVLSAVKSERAMPRDEPHASKMSSRRRKRHDQLPKPSEPPIETGTMRQLRGRRKGTDEEEDVALDICPELVQAKDLLSRGAAIPTKQWSAEDAKEAREHLETYVSKAEPIQRVRKLQGHMDAVLSVEMDARRLITGSMDRSVRIWDIRSGRSLHKLLGHKGGVTCMVFDNETMYTGSWDTSIMVWNMLNFERETVLTGHKGSISCLAMNDDYVFSGSHDFTVRIWLRSTLLCSIVIEGHGSHVTCMALQGPHVITGSSSRSIRITEFLTGVCVKVIKTSYPVTTLWMTGSLLLTGNQRGEVHVINKYSGEPEVAIQAHDAPITRVTFFSNHIFTTSDDSTIKEWDLMTMACIRSLQGHKGAVKDIKICSKCIVSAGADGHVRVWDKILPMCTVNSEDQIRVEVIDQTLCK